MGKVVSTADRAVSSSCVQEKNQKGHFERINKERSREVDSLRADLADARAQADAFETKYKSQSSRTRNLERMLMDLKGKMTVRRH